LVGTALHFLIGIHMRIRAGRPVPKPRRAAVMASVREILAEVLDHDKA
jgi:hypothetical protein